MEIERFIKEVLLKEQKRLKEVAVSAKQASHLALYVQRDSRDMRCILYDTEILIALYKAYTKHYSMNDMRNIQSTQQHDSIPNPVFGMIRIAINAEYNAWVVQNSAAEKGYGPLMYDIAFSFAGEKGMTPDRDSVRPAAKNVWKHILLKRPNEFEITPLKNTWNDQGVEHHSYNDENQKYLDSKYVWKQSNRKDFGPMFQKNRQTLSYLKTLDVKHKIDPEEFLKILSRIFFREKYSPSSFYW